MATITTGLAFIAGVASFFTPCVLPLLPGFLAYLSGIDSNNLQKEKGFNLQLFLNTLFYVLGFTLVFAVIGILLTTTLVHVNLEIRRWLSRVGGVIIIGFGLFLLGVIKIPFLDRSHAPHVRKKASYTTSFLFGVAFAVGWTPCVGAVLGSIFTLSASKPEIAFILMLTYAFGLALPFLIVGATYSYVAPYLKKSGKWSRIISIIMGVILVLVGILLLFNRLSVFGVSSFFGGF